MIKSIKRLLIFAILGIGLSGCAANKDLENLKKAQFEQAEKNRALQEKQAELLEKIALLTTSVQQWQAVQPGVTRLVAIEEELNGLIAQLNAIIDGAENEKKHTVQKASSESQKSKKPTMVQQNDKFYALQLISVTSVQAVQKSWHEVYQKNSQLLSEQLPVIEKIEIKGKIYYRIKAGKFSSKDAASELCKQLKKQQTACLVAAYSGQPLQQFIIKN